MLGGARQKLTRGRYDPPPPLYASVHYIFTLLSYYLYSYLSLPHSHFAREQNRFIAH